MQLGYPNVVLHCNSEVCEIDNHLCTFFRDSGWKFANEPDKDKKVREECVLSCDLLVYINDSNLGSLAKTQANISDMILKPRNIIYINHSNLKPSEIKQLCQNNAPAANWSIETIINQETTKLEAVDCGSLRVKSPYFCVFEAGDLIPKNYLSDIDAAYFDKLEKFLAMIPTGDAISGFFCQTRLYNNLGKNTEKPIVDKLRNVCKSQSCEYMLREYNGK
jgi:hypothetical protein